LFRGSTTPSARCPRGLSRRCVYLPPGAKEPDANYLSFLEFLALPLSLQQVVSCGLAIKGNQWTLRQHQESWRILRQGKEEAITREARDIRVRPRL
jgi:hypothetical protein